MKGKHAGKKTRELKTELAATLKTRQADLTVERNKRVTLERKLVEQSSLRDEIARLREQVENGVSSKYLKLEKKYSRARNTINKLNSRLEAEEEKTGVLIGMYAQECGVTRSQAMDAWVGRLTGSEDALILFENHRGKIGAFTRRLEEMRRKRFERKQYRRKSRPEDRMAGPAVKMIGTFEKTSENS